MATITTEGVTHVANLARLEFNEEEIQHFTEQLARILDYIGKLNELETTDVEPTSHIHPLQNVTKPDVAKPFRVDPDEKGALLSNAPDAESGYFGVPRVVDTA